MGYLLPGLRAREMAAVAAEHAMEFLAQESVGLTNQPFSLFMQSDGHLAENLLVGRRHGHEVYGFDYPFLVGHRPEREFLPAGFPTIAYESGIQYGCVLVATEGSVPMLHVSSRGRRGLLPSGIETPFRAGSKDFLKMFRLWAEEPDFLPEILTPDVMDLLVRTDGRFTFEFHMDAVLCVARKLKPTDFPPLMALVAALVKAIPGSVWDAYPRTVRPVIDLSQPAVPPSPMAAPHPETPLPAVAPAPAAEPDPPEGWTTF